VLGSRQVRVCVYACVYARVCVYACVCMYACVCACRRAGYGGRSLPSAQARPTLAKNKQQEQRVFIEAGSVGAQRSREGGCPLKQERWMSIEARKAIKSKICRRGDCTSVWLSVMLTGCAMSMKRCHLRPQRQMEE